jgi:hypothetical protein
MFAAFDIPMLVECLGHMPPVELKGLELLRQLRPLTGTWFPQIPADVLAEATAEIIDYTRACSLTVHKLQALPPITLSTVSVQDFCL